MTDEIIQFDHYLSPGDRVVLAENGYKRMSLRDVFNKTVTYRVVAVINRDTFKLRKIAHERA